MAEKTPQWALDKIKECKKKNSKKLDLNGYGQDTKIKHVPVEIFELTQLEVLFLSDNSISDIPESIKNLQNLINLDLMHNQLTSLPESITKKQNLNFFILKNKQLNNLPESIKNLQNLEELSLYGNQLTSLPETITKLRKLNLLILDGNPLETPPPEIVEKGIEAIFEYFRSWEGKAKQALNEVKVLLVGDGGAGKTSLVKLLLGDEFDKNEEQTEGININQWDIKSGKENIKVHLWDFGGQDIMHATHQFFLTKRSLYILVLDGRKEEDAEYWLKHIESFGGDSPIFVTLNKIDINRGYDVNRRYLKDKFKGIKGFYRISCSSGDGIKEFNKDLKKALGQVDIIKTIWAKSWFNVKTALETMKDNFISLTKFKNICK